MSYSESFLIGQALDTIPHAAPSHETVVSLIKQKQREIVVDSLIQKQNALLALLEKADLLTDSKIIEESRRRSRLDAFFFRYTKDVNDRFLSPDSYFLFEINESMYNPNDSSVCIEHLKLLNRVYGNFQERTSESYGREDGDVPQVKMLVSVFGFASPDGPKEYNLKLAQKRAQSITAILEKLNTNDQIVFCPVAKGESVFYNMDEMSNKYKRSVVLRLACTELAPKETCQCRKD